MATERPPGVVSSSTTKSLARPVLTGRTMVRKTGPRPCNLPSMKKSNINDTNHVEIVPPGSTGWAKTPKPISDDGNAAISNTWTVPPRVTAGKIKPSKKPAETRYAEPTANSVAAKAAGSSEPTKNAVGMGPEIKSDAAQGSSAAPLSSLIDNPFGIDIHVTSWAREVSPPPSARKAWSDASPMDFSKPVVFEQHAASNSSAASAPMPVDPCPDNAWRPAIIRKPTVSSILKKPEAERHPPSELEPEPARSSEAVTPSSLPKPAPVSAVDETVQALTMKQKAEEAMRRRQEQEKLREEQVRARLAEKLAALEKKTAFSKQMSGPISVMQRPKDVTPTVVVPPSSAASSTPAAPHIAASPPAAETRSSPSSNVSVTAEARVQDNPSPTQGRTKGQQGHGSASALESSSIQNASSERSGTEPGLDKPSAQGRSSASTRHSQEESKPFQSHRRDRRHGHRRHHHDAPGLKLTDSRSWNRPLASAKEGQDEGQRSSEKVVSKEGERSEVVSERVSAAPANIPLRENRRREDRSRRSGKGPSKTQRSQSGLTSSPVVQSEPSPDLEPKAAPVPKGKSSHGHRKWRAKESASPASSADSTPVPIMPSVPLPVKPVETSSQIEEKPPETSTVPALSSLAPASSLGRGPRQWKSAASEAQSETEKKRHRPKRGGGRRPDPFRNVFENDPVVGSETGTLMWSAAAPVIGSTNQVPPSGCISAPRSWSSSKPSKSNNAQLLTQQQSRIKKTTPIAPLAARVLADTLAASRSN